MKVFISGGTGFVGRSLSRRLLNLGHDVVASGTRPRQTAVRHDRYRYVSADTTASGSWQEALKDVDAVVNLAGRSIFNYWTDYYKEQMAKSRVLTTRHLVDALPEGKSVVFCSTSAVGYYGDREDEVLDETKGPGAGFLSDLSRDWESEAMKAADKGARVVRMRFGIILGQDGGALKQMLPAFRLGLGGPLGDGKQWFPWIHIADVVGAAVFALERSDMQGVFNFTAPEPVQSRDFARELGRVLHRPAILPAPAFMIKTVMGELGRVLLSSQRAVPEALLAQGYRFDFPELAGALEDLVR